MAAKNSKINTKLERAVYEVLKHVMDDSTSSLNDKCKAIDRALKLEAIKAKFDDAGYGSGFGDSKGDKE